MGNKVIKILDKTLDRFVIIVCIILLLMGVYSLLDNYWLYQNALDNSVLVYKPDLDKPLKDQRKITENQVAWVTVYNTNVDFPVMQGKDNYEYLNKDPYGEFSLSGSIFLDFRNNPELTDNYSIIYGHHMAGGAMFGALDDFRDRAFFDGHREGRIVTNNKVYDFTLFAVCEASAGDNAVFGTEGQTTSKVSAYLEKKASIYIKPDENDRIVALSTCSADMNAVRLLVIGTIKER